MHSDSRRTWMRASGTPTPVPQRTDPPPPWHGVAGPAEGEGVESSEPSVQGQSFAHHNAEVVHAGGLVIGRAIVVGVHDFESPLFIQRD